MNQYDPLFGETFYNDTFHSGIAHKDILQKITCKTLLMKAKSNNDNGDVLLAAMSEDDAILVSNLICKSQLVHFDCGHGVHIEKEKEFIKAIINFAE